MAGSDTSRDDDILADAKEAFEAASDAEAENRVAALDDIRFAWLDEQWPAQVRRDRELDGRPCLTINKLKVTLKQVLNDARQNKPAIQCHPVDSRGDPETADIFNGLIRNIEQSSDADTAYDTALEFAVTGGFGYFRINTRYATDDTFDQDLVIERIANPFSVYGDPNSICSDSSDWNTAFIVDSMPKPQFERRYRGADAVDWSLSGYSQLGSPWRDGDNVMVAEHWTREQSTRKIVLLSQHDFDPTSNPELAVNIIGLMADGPVIGLDVYKANKALFDAAGMSVIGKPRDVASHKVTQRILTGAEVLDTVEWAGVYIPIVPVYGEDVFVDGHRHLRGLVRSAKDPQRRYNYWVTQSTELVALAPKAPWIGPKGAFDSDAQKWASANTENHQFIEYDGGIPPQRQPFAGQPVGAMQEALNASDDIKATTGIFSAALGQTSNETSGRAILARQREGDVSTFNYIDNLSRSIRHAGRILIDMIPKVYSAPRVVRVLGQDGTAETVQVNQKFTAQAKQPGGQMAEIEKIYDLGAGKYDLTVTAGPSFTTQREEAASQMIELIRAYPPAAPIIGDLLAKNLDWPGADEIAKRLKAMLPPQLQDDAGPNPEVEQAKALVAQLQEVIQKGGAELADANLALKSANDAHDIALEKLKVDQFNAETNRMKVEADNPGAEALIPAIMQAMQMVMAQREPAEQPALMATPEPDGDEQMAAPEPDADEAADLPPSASEAVAVDEQDNLPPSAAEVAEMEAA